MTNIFENIKYKKELREKNKGKKEITQAEQLFLDNIGQIEKIKTTKWYKMIRNFWVAEGNHALSELNKLDINDISDIIKQKSKLELSTTFISYLDAHEKGLS